MSARGIYRILRLPLVITAMADVVAGYTVALLPRLHRFDWHEVVLLAGASAGLYLFGMVENDLADVRRDRLLGQRRPLVTGEIGLAAAVVLLVLAAVLAGVCVYGLRAYALSRGALSGGGTVMVAIAAFAAINLYNLAAKRGPSHVAMTVMGLCRILNFALGVVAAVGFPREVGVGLLLPTGPLWVRHGLALFFTTWIATGYSIGARQSLVVSTRPWQVAFFAAALGGFGLVALSTMPLVAAGEESGRQFIAPMARVVAFLLLTGLWPGGLWSVTGPARRPADYGAFIERALYWMIVLDAAFVLDGLLTV